LVRKLGEGGFGEVWKAQGPGGIAVALKFIGLGDDAGTIELHALEVIKDIRHPHLVGLFGAWQQEGQLIIAMELADGTLADRLSAAQREGLAGIPLPELLEYLREAAKGLDHLNTINIQHQDVKPQNLLLVGGGVKVADFGLAKLMVHTVTSKSHGSLSVAYAPPEFHDRKTTRWSDQYSLAVSYCQLRGGRLPFDGTPVQVMIGHVMHPPDLTMLPAAERPAVAKALAKEPKDRWPSCRAFVDALARPAVPGEAHDERQFSVELPCPKVNAEVVLKVEAHDERQFSVEVTRATTAPPGREFTNTLGMKLVRLEPGTFPMGSPETDKDARDRDNEKPQHEVEITRPFYMAVHTVTVGQFRQFVEDKKYRTEAERAGDASTWKMPGWEQTDRYPVVCVSWNDALAFCEWLSQKEGRTYELPLEAEWEYACRAGTRTRYFFGDDAGKLREYAWYGENANEKAHEVGTKKPNDWGLYDMHGNVNQWCIDGKRKYDKEYIKDPKGPLDGARHVLRGGDWDDYRRYCRAACSYDTGAGYRSHVIGFRVVLRPGPRTP
jgi:formylglycine-generating enzyme required for sulfatase activity